MIQDRLIHAGRYAGLHPLFADAFAWCADPANLALGDGRHALRGEDLFAIVESGVTRSAVVKRFESHRRYIDIQVNLAGPEVMEWTPVEGLALLSDFQADGDIRFHHQPDRPVTRLVVEPGEFAIFWPSDAHKPCCHPGDAPVPYRKLVLKVAAG